jgi:hypothetical protein
MTQGILLGFGIFVGLLIAGIIATYIVEIGLFVGAVVGLAFLYFYAGSMACEIALFMALGVGAYLQSDWRKTRSVARQIAAAKEWNKAHPNGVGRIY